MENKPHNQITHRKSAIIITAITTVAAIVLLVAMLVTHVDPKLTKIEISSPPYKTEYIEKQTLDITGLKVKAYYGNNAVEVKEFTTDKTVLEYGDDTVTVSFTDGKITKTASFSVSVVRKSIVSIEVTQQPNKTVYLEGAVFDPSGIEVTAHYDNGETAVVDDWECDLSSGLSVLDKAVIISYCGVTTEVSITVEQKHLQGIYLDRLPTKLKYTAGEYFDFLGLVLYAKYGNAPDERIYDWELDIVRPLTVYDSSVNISYSLHDITESVVIDIEVAAAEQIADEQKSIIKLIGLLPPVDKIGVDNLGALNYVLSALYECDITEEQQKLREELNDKRNELLAEIPEGPEREYNIEYKINGGLLFEDINYGDNPVKIKDGQAFELKAAFSDAAVDQGYEFTGWSMDGRIITSLSDIKSDKTIYAMFALTPTIELRFIDRISGEELWIARPLRTDRYSFDSANISSLILNKNGVLPVAYYSTEEKRIDSVDLNSGSSATVRVLTARIRELHLANENMFTVGWKYEFTVNEIKDETVAVAKTGSVFYIPIGAQVTITATNANTDGIILDGKDIGTNINSSVVHAVFEMTESEYPASVTYTTKLKDMTTLSFVGQNVHSVVYPAGWNGVMAEIDLNNLAFVFDEAGTTYLNVYNIDGKDYYFDDLTSYVFDGDTVINVIKKYNNFSLTVKYANGKEVVDDITGKQSLSAALSAYSDEALTVLNIILDTSRLFTDAALTLPITKNELLSELVRRDITVYSDWEYISEEPDVPTFDPVDYGEYSFVNTWSSLFSADGEILSCELVFTDDGNYSYKTYINGVISADAHGAYRLNNNAIEIKTFIRSYNYDIFSADDITVNISFCADGLLLTTFVRLVGTQKTTFEQVLFCGEVRPVNYSAMTIVGSYDVGGINIALLENGTAIIKNGENTIEAYYRIDNGERVYLMENGSIGTGDITDILEGVNHE